ncbi:hypothetical protein I4U23_000504 [Adineta vaga]|nr:hypothetical protein I4U23_000504 [Adineta vaga]
MSMNFFSFFYYVLVSSNTQSFHHFNSTIFDRLYSGNQSFLSIDLHDLGIKTIESDTFVNYPLSVHTIILSSNHLSSLPRNLFKSFSKTLFNLNLQNNQFESLSENSFLRSLKQLHTLDLSQNHLHELFIQDFLGLKHLNTLILRQNRITYLSYGIFTYCHQITTLDLSDNQISIIDSNAFLILKNLKILLLNNNPLGQRSLTNNLLKPLKNLQYLDLENTQLENLPSFLFLFNQQLKSIKLRGNYFRNENTSLPLKQTFCGVKSLVEIDLVSSNIHSLDICTYYHISSLRQLYLMNNPLDCTCDLFYLKYGDIYRLLLGNKNDFNQQNYLNDWITRIELRRHLEKAYERGDFHRFPIDLSAFARCKTPKEWKGYEINNITGIYQQCRHQWSIIEEKCRNYYESSLPSIFQQQITEFSLDITDRNGMTGSSTNYTTNVYERFLKFFKKLKSLTIIDTFNPSYPRLSLHKLSPTTFFSSTLTHLCIDLYTFDDCLYLLDGRLKQLSTLIIRISFIRESFPIIHNTDDLPNLKNFSLKCYLETNQYDNKILSLLHRMPFLEKLTLYVRIKDRARFIHNTHLENEIIIHMPPRHSFTFYISTHHNAVDLLHDLSEQDNEKIVTNVQQQSVAIIVHYTNNHNVYKIPFNHEFFVRIARSFPLLINLRIMNVHPQSTFKLTTDLSDRGQSYSIAEYPFLTSLDVRTASNDYAEQFLNETKTYVPHLAELTIYYSALERVTNNFTKEETRRHCAKFTIFDKFYSSFIPNNQTIDLHNVSIETIKSDTFVNYPNSTHTIILSPHTFKSFSKTLFNLNLQNNQFESLSENSFLRSLEQLHFLGLKHLDTLILRQNRITYLSYGIFTYCHQITTLDLSDNQISIIDSNAFLILKNLKILLLNNNPLGQRSLTNNLLKPLKNLQYLDLENTQLENLPSFLFLFNQQLKSIKLRGNYFRNENTSLPLKQTFCGVKSLVEIDLVSSNIHSLDICTYYHISSLRQLYLMDNPCNLFYIKYGDIHRLLIKNNNENIENYLNHWITRIELRRHLEKAYERGDFYRFPIDLSAFARCKTPKEWKGYEINNITGIYQQCQHQWSFIEGKCRNYCQKRSLFITNHSILRTNYSNFCLILIYNHIIHNEIRVHMTSIRNTSLCIYIGNTSSIDDQVLLNYCSKFGTILSCSIAECPDDKRLFCDFRIIEFSNQQHFEQFLNFPQHGIDSIKLDIISYENLLNNFDLLNLDRKLFVGPIINQNDIKTIVQFYKIIDSLLHHCLSRQQNQVYILIEFSSRQYIRTIIQQQTIPKTIDNQIFTIHPAVHPKEFTIEKNRLTLNVHHQIYVNGLTDKISEKMLIDYFDKRTHVIACYILPNDSKCAIIEFENEKSVEKLLEMSKIRLYGTNLFLSKVPNHLLSTLSSLINNHRKEDDYTNDEIDHLVETTSSNSIPSLEISECGWTSPPRTIVNHCPVVIDQTSRECHPTIDVQVHESIVIETDIKPMKHRVDKIVNFLQRFENELEQIKDEYMKKFSEDRISIEHEFNRIMNDERIGDENYDRYLYNQQQRNSTKSKENR